MAATWYAVWVPVVAFAHLFSLFWLLKTWVLSTAHGLLHKKQKRTKSMDVAAAAQYDSPSPLPQHVAVAFKDISPQKRQSLKQHMGRFLGLGHTFTVPQDSPHSAPSNSDDLDAVNAVPDVSLDSCSSLRCSTSLVPGTISMEWQDMGCTYRLGGVAKVVLQGISGGAVPGEMQVTEVQILI